jgi:exodeoxyribonuclease-5
MNSHNPIVMDSPAPSPTKKSYNLNKDQQRAADMFMEFLFSPDKEFIITGPAGVGKTYLMNYIVDTTMPRYHEMCELLGEPVLYQDVVMTATTNKAAEVLSKSVGRPAKTIHSFFNLTVKDDYQTGKTAIKKTSRWVVHSGKIIFIDESSMIDTELWKTLHEGTVNCKLVYVGDRHQLAPVQEDLSPVYKHSSSMVELLEPVRNRNQPPLMAICQQLRDTVATGDFNPIQVVPGVIDLLDPKEMQAEILAHFLQQTHEARILAYTNKQVIAYNTHIRSIRGLPDSFTAGEYLVSSSVVHTRTGQIPVEMELEVVRNRGADQIMVDKSQGVHIDVDMLDIRDSFGELFLEVPVMTNRPHFEDLTKYYARDKNWGKYFELKNNIADLRPRDAATVHKSQGSTYDTVFIDLGNISTCHQSQQVARMLYVAFSRARSRVFLYGDLATKYGGLVLP